jgi:thiol-disulfide isomerase/thioredoxin
MSRYRWALTILAGVAALAIVLTWVLRSTPPSADTGTGSAALIPAEERTPAGNFTGIDGWINSPPLTLDSLRGKVVLVDFWTFSCVNCVRTIPHLQHLQQTYGGRGLVIVGVHSPEFDFEKVQANVVSAVHRFGVTWPVAVDSEMSTWNAYNNQYWPAEYLIDQNGKVARVHDGEGEYEVTESAIAALLGVSGTSPAPAPSTPNVSSQTAELYAGSDRQQPLADGESWGPAAQPINYPDPGSPSDSDRIQVTGSWADHGQYLVSTSAGHIRLKFAARDVYLVVGPDASSSVHASFSLDGASVRAAERGSDLSPSGLDVAAQQLYHVLSGIDGNRHLIDVSVPAGLRLYTFTFG